MPSNPAPRRQSPRPLARLLCVAALFAAVWALLEAAVSLWFAGRASYGLHLTLVTIGFEIASGTLALWLARGNRAPPVSAAAPAAAPAPLSVLVAAYDEEAGIVATVRSILAQQGVAIEVVIADDGSSDDTVPLLCRAFDLRPSTSGIHRSREGKREGQQESQIVVLSLPHRGKGATLNAAAAVARHPLLVTVDADTLLAPLALARLAAAFNDPTVAAATGSVLVARTPSLLTRFQQIEYVRNTLIRVAWAGLSALEQLPGAFMAVRADWLTAAGGYPTQSLTEDYELVYRIYRCAAQTGRPLQISVVPTACAYTDAPGDLRSLMRQRTRWFAGFLTTLFRFRQLIGNPKAGVFGVVKLPIKVLDAIHPPLSLLSLLILIADANDLVLRPLALALFALRWFWDSLTLALAVRFARRQGAEIDLGRAGSVWPWVYVLADGVSYFWLRQLAVLRAYAWAVRPPKQWKPLRSAQASPPAADLAA